MPPRFDDQALTLKLSIADLLEREIGRSLGFANRGGYERLWVGQAIHSRYQDEAMQTDPSYRREVSVCLEMVHRGWQVELLGRIDGVCRDRDGVLWVEEIKSVRPGAQLAPAVADMYRRQALLYAWMLAELGDEPVRAVLVLIEIGGGGIEREVLDVDARGLEAGVRRRLNTLLREHERQRQAARRRRDAGERLAFPFFRARPGQDEIIEDVERALENREHLLVEAATGLGKTAATLYPVMRYALAHEKRVFVLTAKTLQQEMATAVLELLNREGGFRSLRLRAKAGMCANGEILCHEEYCPYAKDYYLKLQSSHLLHRLVEEHHSLLPDRIFEAAKAATVCPFEVSLEIGERVQATVCDYNYAFEPYVALGEFGSGEDLSNTILVIDEIHNLVDRGRGYYSPRLGAGRARAVARSFMSFGRGGRGGQAMESRIEELCSELAALIEETVDEQLGYDQAETTPTERAAEVALPEEQLWALRPEFDRAFIDYLEYRRDTKSFRPEDPFVELYFDVLRFLNTLQVSGSEAFSHCAQIEAEEKSLRVLCKDASHFLGQVINRTHTVIGLSATLSPPEFYRDLLGFDSERTSTIQIPNPFPAANRQVVIDSSVATTYKQRPDNYRPIAERLGEFANSVPGNCLALFPSYHFLREVAERLPATDKRVLIQQRADGQQEREEILETLRSALFGDILLLAVAGGVFAEGVDYPGDMLRAVAVVGPCLPAVSLEQKLLESYYEERYERGFEYAFVVPGMTRVVQAAGRLIRSDQDTGVIALFDRRFLAKPYCRHLPEEWQPVEGWQAITGHPASAAAAFFQAQAQPDAGEAEDDAAADERQAAIDLTSES